MKRGKPRPGKKGSRTLRRHKRSWGNHHPPDTRRPGPAWQSGDQADIRDTHRKYTAPRMLGQVLGGRCTMAEVTDGR